jgi:hypothetical protein
MVEQRAWDIVLDLTILSFNWTQVKATSSIVEDNMGKFESQE